MAKRSTEKKWEKSQDKRIAAAEKRADAERDLLDTLEKMEKLNLRMTKEQKEKLKGIREEKKLAESLKTLSDDKATTLEKIAKRERDVVGISKNAYGLSNRILKTAKGNLEVIEAAAKNKKIDVDLANKLQVITANVADEETTLADLKSQSNELQQMLLYGSIEEGSDTEKHIKNTLKLNELEVARREVQEQINESLSTADGLIGGMGDTIKGFLLNPLTGAVALLVAFNAQQEAIADEFGAIGVTEFRGELAGASQEFVKMGLEGSEALTTAKELSSEFGIGFENAIAMADSVGNIAKSTGMGTAEATKLMGIFTEIGGLTEQGAEDLAKQAESLAVANGVAPGVVLKDIAANSETFANFSGAGAQGLTRAAIQARKLGVEFSSIAGAAESMLDFQSSLNAEVEASVLLGRNVNLQKARELALSNDIEGFQKEILNQVGSQAEFDKMNVLQKKALAQATGLTVAELQKMVKNEKEAVTLSGQLGKQDISKLVPEETITATADLIANLQAIGMSLAETLGPTISFVATAFSGFLGFVDKFIGIGPALIALFIAIKGKAMIAAGAMLIKAVSGFFAGASAGSTATAGFGTPALVAMAAAAVAVMFGAINKATGLIGDMHSPADGKTQISTKEGGLFEFSKNDDVLAAPGLSSAVNNMGGGGNVINNMNTKGMEKQGEQTNQLLTQLIQTTKKSGTDAGKAAAKGVLQGV